MSEKGELKKRIRKVSWIDGEFRVANFDSFRVIVDEAKKASPKLPKRPNSADRLLNSIEWMEWFEKWFGK